MAPQNPPEAAQAQTPPEAPEGTCVDTALNESSVARASERARAGCCGGRREHRVSLGKVTGRGVKVTEEATCEHPLLGRVFCGWKIRARNLPGNNRSEDG